MLFRSDENHYVRMEAAMALGRIGGDPTVIVPALVRCLEEETNGFQSTLIITAITRFGTNARPAIPILVKIIESKQIGVANHALGALQKIDPETAKPFIEKRDAGGTNAPLASPPLREQ